MDRTIGCNWQVLLVDHHAWMGTGEYNVFFLVSNRWLYLIPIFDVKRTNNRNVGATILGTILKLSLCLVAVLLELFPECISSIIFHHVPNFAGFVLCGKEGATTLNLNGQAWFSDAYCLLRIFLYTYMFIFKT